MVREYATDDLRISIVYRARCFRDEQERQRYLETGGGPKMSLDEILRRLALDLADKGILPSAEAGLQMPRIDFAQLLLDSYVAYPLPRAAAAVPFNYCMLPKAVPAMAGVLTTILSPFCA